MKRATLGLNLTTRRARKREFLDEMNRVVPWAALVELVAPFAPEGRGGRAPFAVETMLPAHFMRQWFTLSDPATEEALHDTPLLRFQSVKAIINKHVQVRHIPVPKTRAANFWRMPRMHSEIAPARLHVSREGDERQRFASQTMLVRPAEM